MKRDFTFQLNNLCRNSTNKNSDTFVGIKFSNGTPEVVFPIGYDIPDESKYGKENILKLINCIKSYNDGIKRSNTFSSEHHQSGNDVPIYSFIWIINEYIKNGLTTKDYKTYKMNQSGKIIWKKTLKQFPVINNGNFIFLNTIVQSKELSDDLLAEIHLLCLEYSTNYIGWLFGEIKFRKSRLSKITDKELFLKLLNNEFFKSFDDKRRQLILHLRDVVTFISKLESLSVKLDFGIFNFEYVWEDIVRNLLGSDLNTFAQPTANWFILNDQSFKSTNLRPDAIRLKDDLIYIADAKYYSYGITGHKQDLPNTSSISKQIIYGENTFTRVKDYGAENVLNAFLLPYNKNHNKFNVKSDVALIGYAKGGWKDKEFEPIHQNIGLILVDTSAAISKYNARKVGNASIFECFDSISTMILNKK